MDTRKGVPNTMNTRIIPATACAAAAVLLPAGFAGAQAPQNTAPVRALAPDAANPNAPAGDVLQKQGDAHFGAGGKTEQENAVRAYTQAALANPKNAATRLCLGVSLAALKQTDLALEQFKVAAHLAPDDVLCALLYQNALSERGNGAEAQEMRLEIAQKFARKDGAGLDARVSVASLRAGVQKYPKSPILYLLLGDAYQTGENWKAADAAYQTARVLAPHWAKPCVNLGLSRLAQNRPADAIATFEDALIIEPGSVQARLWKGNAELKAGKNDEAVRSFQGVSRRALPSVAPNVAAQAATGIGQVMARSRHFDKALVSLQTAQKIEPSSPVPPALIGEVHLQNGDYKAAANSYETALRLTRSGGLFSNRPVLYRALAEAQLCAREPAKALASLSRALLDEPESAALWHRLKAQAYFDQNQNADAQNELRFALDNALPGEYPLDTLNAIAARNLIVVMMSDYEADLSGGGVRRTTLPGGATSLVARPRVPGGQEATTLYALHGLANLARYRSDIPGEIHYRTEIVKQRGTGVDFLVLADAYDSRANQPANARSAYSEAIKKGGLSKAATERVKERLVRLNAPLYKP